MLMTVGVVYCQMHYGVDALGGLVVGLIATWLVNKAWAGGANSVRGEPRTNNARVPRN
jgi:membrane-associated phospholipid phosphatase